jgi:Zn-dependent protease with chaperone function
VKEQTVLDVVNEMALAAHIYMPRVCLMEDPAPNAFATGRDPEHSVICLTRGLVDQLDREELQGAIAHEIAHIRGHDTRVTQMPVVMVGGFSLVTGAVMRFMRAIQVRRPGDQGGAEAAIPGIGIITIPLLILGGLGWIFSKMVAIALSRQREYLADAASVEFTRSPQALIRALEHIARIESPLRQALRDVAPLFILDPSECAAASSAEYFEEVARIEAQADKTKEERDAEVVDFVVKRVPPNPFQGRFSSHPPIRDRVARLYALLHQTIPAESPEEIRAKTSAAAKIVSETSHRVPLHACSKPSTGSVLADFSSKSSYGVHSPRELRGKVKARRQPGHWLRFGPTQAIRGRADFAERCSAPAQQRTITARPEQ